MGNTAHPRLYFFQGEHFPHPSFLPEGEGIPHPNPLPGGKGIPHPNPLPRGEGIYWMRRACQNP